MHLYRPVTWSFAIVKAMSDIVNSVPIICRDTLRHPSQEFLLMLPRQCGHLVAFREGFYKVDKVIQRLQSRFIVWNSGNHYTTHGEKVFTDLDDAGRVMQCVLVHAATCVPRKPDGEQQCQLVTDQLLDWCFIGPCMVYSTLYRDMRL